MIYCQPTATYYGLGTPDGFLNGNFRDYKIRSAIEGVVERPGIAAPELRIAQNPLRLPSVFFGIGETEMPEPVHHFAIWLTVHWAIAGRGLASSPTVPRRSSLFARDILRLKYGSKGTKQFVITRQAVALAESS
jgi:hypothetical protein